MIRNPSLVREFERDLIRANKADHKANLKIAEALYKEAQALGEFPPTDPLEGLDVDIRIAKALNRVRTTPRQNRRRARQT